MKQGLYEQVINQLVAKQLTELDAAAFEVGTEKLDVEAAAPAEAPENCD